MVIACIQEYEGSLALYDELTAEVDVVNNPPAGLIFHWVAGVDESHIRVTDVWESQDHLAQWVTRTTPMIQNHDIAAPSVQVLEVHRYQAGQKGP